MPIIPPSLARRSSTWSILRSLDAFSPPPSWSSLDNLTACCQFGSIPLILHAGVGELPNLINGAPSDADSRPLDPFDREYKGGPTLDNNTEPYQKTPEQRLANWCIEPHEETCLQESLSLLHCPQRPPSTPKSSPEKLRRIAIHKASVHVAPEISPTSCDWSSVLQVTPSGSSPRTSETGKLSECQGLSGHHKRKGSTSTTDSGLSSVSNAPIITHDVNRIISENASIDAERLSLPPSALSWLQSTVLEVMIDQEGFRMIKPVFRFAGYSWPTATEGDVTSLGVHLVSGTADFMPLQRKSFAFHHSALDTPPVLRRLMVNCDTSCDYLSRQAYLILKANGPYTVQGTELVQSAHLIPSHEAQVLAWRFDYIVADRRTEAGRIIPGEKTLTPLIFSCSPALLRPLQAKNISVVHVVKKSVTAKLTATKMEPPTPPSPCPVPGATSNAGSELHEAAVRRRKRAKSDVQRDSRSFSISTHDSA
jgi:hypothetical protein